MTMTENRLTFNEPVDATDEDFTTETVYSRVSSTICYPSDASTEDQMNVVESSGTLEFWDDPSEDVYTESDGDAI
jgi:hypothetical protein